MGCVALYFLLYLSKGLYFFSADVQLENGCFVCYLSWYLVICCVKVYTGLNHLLLFEH